RATQLREVSGFKEAGVYDPPTIGGTSVIYVLHDINHPEKYGNLPKEPRISAAFTIWKEWFKPIGLFGAMLGFVGVVMHYVFEGPRRTQPLPPIKQIDPPDHAAGKEN
ncbi:MAG: formate dehydrogenase N subunit beta transmembrane domain-containing protein, partial [Candidatus Korobacteraceae bacterium]